MCIRDSDYLGYDQIFAVGGTWMCKSDVIKAGDWAKITAQSKDCLLYTSRCV